jgi:mannose-6-phosphate isomerase-like protein (cupin superfamily)
MPGPQVSAPLPTQPGPYRPRHCAVEGSVTGVLFAPEGVGLWCGQAHVTEGAALTWNGDHGDHAVYVLSGGLTADRTFAGSGAVVVVEANASARVTAVTDTTIIHFGPNDPSTRHDGLLGPPAGAGSGVHVIAPGEASALRFAGDGATSVYYRDGTCTGCRITVFLYDGSAFVDGYVGASHVHSEDEIMHVLDGELRVGPLVVKPGQGIAVPGGVRYSFRTPGPYRYVTYRADVSTAVVEPGSDPVLETVDTLRSYGASSPTATGSN